MDDFSLARPVGHLIMWDGSGPDGLAEKDGAKALSGAESVDTATTQLDKPSRTKNLINEYKALGLTHLVVDFRRDNLAQMLDILDLMVTQIRPAVQAG